MTIKRLLLLTAAALAAILAACILVYRMLTSGRVDPLTLLFLAAVISIALPMVRANFFPSARDCEAEFDFHVKRQEAFIRQQISDKLGPEALNRIFTGGAPSKDNGADYLMTLVAEGEGREDPDLQFALLSALGRYYVETGDPDEAIESLTTALQSRPQDFVTRFNLARNYEWQGSPRQALDIYRRILETPEGLSRAMIKLARRRMADLEAG
jgi:tetratricopeptide (TPR) repeat protein